jgi:DNA polymerase-3 subunit beta
MKLVCDKNDLHKFIGLAERNTSKSPTLPILSAISLKAAKNRLFISSTNLEVGFEANIPAKIEKDGEVVPPAKTFLSVLSSIPEEEIIIESKNNNLKIISKTSEINLKCYPLDEFPVIPKIKKENSFIISKEVIIEALKKTIPAAASNYNRPELASIYIFTQSKTTLTFVATDSFRLAEQKTNISCPGLSVLLPQKSGQEVIRIFEELESSDIEMVFNKNQILFQNKNISFISRLTEGKFPDYQNILPKSFLTQVIIDKNYLVNSIRAASVFSSRLSEVVLKANQKEGTLEIKAANNDTGEYNSLCAAKILGEDIETNFNYHYLLDAIHTIPNQKIFLGFNGPQKAILLKGFEDNLYLHLIMPMRGA